MQRVLPVLFVVAVLCGCSDEAAAKAREEALRTELKAEIEKHRKDAERTAQALAANRDELRKIRDEVAAINQRLGEEASRSAGGAAASGTSSPAELISKPAVVDRAAQLAEMKGLQEKVFSGDATEAEQSRFWELARSAAVVDELMKTLEATVKERPDDVAARMELAEAYVSKLMTIPDGPEKGLWSNKAVAQWNEVLKKDADNWDARYSIAFTWSMWPDFLNKTPDAIKEFEKVREIQERRTPEPQHAETYFQLSRLYQKQGKADKAKQALKDGLMRHADDPELKKALDALEN
jgi:tetratricopeptide (TPR) repeat protein